MNELEEFNICAYKGSVLYKENMKLYSDKKIDKTYSNLVI